MNSDFAVRVLLRYATVLGLLLQGILNYPTTNNVNSPFQSSEVNLLCCFQFYKRNETTGSVPKIIDENTAQQ